MSLNAFNIVTEFRFDIASAVADSQTLQNQVGMISDTANQALYSLRRVGMGLVAQMGVFSGGMLGFLYEAVTASEKFAQTQRNLSNVFLQNQDALGVQGMTFLQAMKQSETVMDNIKKKAFSFGLDPSELVAQTKMIAPMMLSHGLDNMNLNNSIDIARGLMKSAPTLGVQPQMVRGELIQLVAGHAYLQNTLFQRLMSETKPFRDNKITTSAQFNILPAQKRVEILRQALLQFGSNAEVIAGNVNSLNGQMTRFMAMIKGEFSILKPLGEALAKPLKMAFEYVIQWLNSNGRGIVKNFSTLVSDFFEDPIKSFVKLRQLSRLQGDVHMAGKLAEFYAIFEGVIWVLKLFGLEVGGFGAILGRAFTMVRAGLAWVYELLPIGAIFRFIGGMIAGAMSVILRVLAPLLFFLQIISATIAKIEVIQIKWLADNASRVSDAVSRIGFAFQRIMLPITLAIDGISDLLASTVGWFFTFDIAINAMEGFAGIMEWIANVIVLALSSVNGIIAGVTQWVIDMSHMNFTGIHDRVMQAFNEGAWDFYKKVYHIKGEDDQSISQQNVNIANLNINNAFKEQMEPDRIAFSLVDQLMKVAQNPGQAAGRTNKLGYVGQ